MSNLAQVTAGRTYFFFNGGEIALPKLSNAVNTYFDSSEPITLNMPSLVATSGSTLHAVAGETINAPLLASSVNTTYLLDAGCVVNMPILTNFSGSTISLTPSRQFNAPPFTKIDNARIALGEGQQLDVAAGGYAWTPRYDASATLMSSDGQGSVLDLGALTLIDASTSWGSGGPYYYSMVASNGGAIDLSGVTTVKGSGDNDWLLFRAVSGGVIDFSSLQSSVGRTWFEVVEGKMLLPALASIESAQVHIKIFQTLDTPSLTTAHDSWIVIESGGTMNAPGLIDVRGCNILLTPSRFMNAPPFVQIDNARISVAEGKSLPVAATGYRWTPRYDASTTLLSADGQGSILVFSALEVLDASTSWGSGGPYFYSIAASNGGAIDLTHVTSIKGAADNEWLRMGVESGGALNFTTLRQIGGRVLLHILDSGSRLNATGNVSLAIDGGAAAITATNLGELHIGGTFLHKITNENDHATKLGTLHMDGSGVQQLEVAGTDVGLPDDTIPNNFDWGAMVVGRDDQPTTVELIDSIDNLNRGPNGEPEALYLSGFPQGEDGLRIGPDSVLVLNGIQAYVGTVNGWVHLNSLFGAGQTRIPYDQGFIQLVLCPPDWNDDGEIDTRDFIAYLNSWVAGDPEADLNEDGLVDTRDFIAYLNLWTGGC